MQIKTTTKGVPTVAQQVKDLVLLQLWCKSQLWLRFDPWPENFHTKKKKNKTKQKKHNEAPTGMVII